ncbi:hypothetical protein [Streptomyces sp. LN699]|uniref:hypothetical protein n=1 Tax=Streptomyces sp. LN699 TaxID=3112981 RepID=UPI0037244FC4
MDAGDLIAVGSMVVAVLAACISLRQAKHASGQVKAAEEQVAVARQQLQHAEVVHREQNEPYVVVDIQPGDTGGVLVVVVENIGSTIARNVRITVDPPLESGWGEDLTQMLTRAFSQTFPMLPPRRRLQFLLDDQNRFQREDLPTAYTFTVRYEGPYGPVEDMEYVVDFGTYAETLLLNAPLEGVEKRLGEIRKELKSLTDSYGKSNAPAIREEVEREVRRLRERYEQARPRRLPENTSIAEGDQHDEEE